MLAGKTVVTLPGCPANPYIFLGTALQYATFGTLPELDELGRPVWAYGRTIHEHCPRRAHFDAGRFAEQFGDEGHRLGYCLYKLGCKGPQTHANCSVLNFNEVQGAFVKQVYLPDVVAIGAMYPDWLDYGAGVTNYLACPTCRSTSKAASSTCPAAPSWAATSPPSRPSAASTTPTSATTSASRSPTPGTTATGRGIPTRRRPSRVTPTSKTTASTRG